MTLPQTFPTLPSPDASLGTWAAWYAAQGFPVFPCQGKTPLTPRGFYDASTDAFKVEMAWRRHPQANIGLATGWRCWVLDMDPRSDGDLTLAALMTQHGRLPETAQVLTGGRDNGVHFYWLLPPGLVVRNKAALGAGLDVQALGAYVIAPPSVHPDTGRRYLWDLGGDLEAPGLAEAPEWLLALVTAPEKAEGAPQTPLKPDTSPGEPIPDGQRNHTLAAMGRAMRHAGFDYAAIVAALHATNTRCVPPLPTADIETIARSQTRYGIDPVLEVQPAPEGEVGAPLQWGSKPNGTNGSGPPPTFLDLADLLMHEYPLPQWIIHGLIPEGLTFFAGSPKSSKTYLAYSLALSLALQATHNGLWLDHYDIHVTGPVIYVSLEDDAADSQFRVRELMPQLATANRERFIFHHGVDIPQLGQGLVEWLEHHFILRYHPALIVLDPISYLYAPQKKQADQFTEVRTMLLPLRTLARTYHLSIIGVDHRRKKSADDVDVFETLYGSNAKIAIADSLLLIVRDNKEITIHARVRKGADQTLTLGFTVENGRAHWTWKGSTDGLINQGQFGDLRHKLVSTLLRASGPLSVADLLHENTLPDSRMMRHSVTQILYRLGKTGEVERTTRGSYVYAGARD